MIFSHHIARLAAFVPMALMPAFGAAQDLPSGMDVTLHEVLVDEVEAETWVRFRFIAPAIDRMGDAPVTYFDAEADFPLLCAELALPYLAEHGLSPDRIVISLSDRAVEFGTFDPDATQFFEGFVLEKGACMWESF